ncbi:hypothetical protein HOC01_02410 [archaeon]|mgnify:FL=1|jgi:hypothetical protein|nr:hypothetical protein [archaeon]MBT6697829.1 hypothetical protein [archaeon]
MGFIGRIWEGFFTRGQEGPKIFDHQRTIERGVEQASLAKLKKEGDKFIAEISLQDKRIKEETVFRKQEKLRVGFCFLWSKRASRIFNIASSTDKNLDYFYSSESKSLSAFATRGVIRFVKPLPNTHYLKRYLTEETTVLRARSNELQASKKRTADAFTGRRYDPKKIAEIKKIFKQLSPALKDARKRA